MGGSGEEISWEGDTYIRRGRALGSRFLYFHTIELLRSKVDLGTTSGFRLSQKDEMRSWLLGIFQDHEFARPLAALSPQSRLSSKVRQLLTFLDGEDPRECSGLIFAQQRATVGVLCTILSTHPETAGRFNCATFVGQSSSAQKQYNLSELFDLRTQNDNMAEFRAGKRHLIITTDALEEGLDVTACNLVICFNPPLTLKSFIQRRGRARMERSKFAVMLPRDSDQNNFVAWQELEKQLIKAYQNEHRVKIKIASLESQEEQINDTLHVESTGYVIPDISIVI